MYCNEISLLTLVISSLRQWNCVSIRLSKMAMQFAPTEPIGTVALSSKSHDVAGQQADPLVVRFQLLGEAMHNPSAVQSLR
jgi:hypothetical protein